MAHNTSSIKVHEIPVNELMIGDWVLVYNKSDESIQMIRMEPEFYSMDLMFVGIPVCEKFFKLNFAAQRYADDSGDCFYINLDMDPAIEIHMHYALSADLSIRYNLNNKSYKFETEIKKRIYFVHELQQALRQAGLKDLANKIKIWDSTSKKGEDKVYW